MPAGFFVFASGAKNRRRPLAPYILKLGLVLPIRGEALLAREKPEDALLVTAHEGEPAEEEGRSALEA
jgi:hypothetical protein